MNPNTPLKVIAEKPSANVDFQDHDFFILGSDSFILDHFNNKLLSITPNVFYLFDIKEETYIFPNKGFDEFLGYEKGSFNPLGRKQLQALMHPEDFAKYDRFISEVKHSKEGSFL